MKRQRRQEEEEEKKKPFVQCSGGKLLLIFSNDVQVGQSKAMFGRRINCYTAL